MYLYYTSDLMYFLGGSKQEFSLLKTMEDSAYAKELNL